MVLTRSGGGRPSWFGRFLGQLIAFMCLAPMAWHAVQMMVK